MKLFRRLCARFRKEKLDAAMSEEMRAHLELQTRANITRGLAPEEARYAARRSFGGVEQLKEHARDQRGWIWLEQLTQDLRYAARALRKSPGFAALVVFSLAISIGANTAIFSLVNDFLLRPLPVKNPQELVLFRYFDGEQGAIPATSEGNSGKDPVTGRGWHASFPLLALDRFEQHHPGIADVFAYAPFGPVNVLVDGQVESAATGQFVSGRYHGGLGVAALLGRTLTSADNRPSAEPVAVLSHRYWQARFNGNPGVLGQTIRLNQVAATIVGVTAPGFSGAMQVGESPDVSVPLGMFARVHPDHLDQTKPWYFWIRIMGRLAPGNSAAQARAGLEPIFQQVAREAWDLRPRPPNATAETMPGLPTLATESGARGKNDRRHEYTKTLSLLMGLVGLVLLAACANVANLLLARGANRRREVAVRLALGATRGRIVRQLLAESLVLAGLGAAFGTLLAGWGRGVLLALQPVGDAVRLDLPLDGRVLGFMLAATGVTVLLFGLAPALRATRLDVSAEFQGGSRTLVGRGRSRLSQVLMVVQLALSLVLLVGAGLFLRTLRNLQAVDPGFNRHGLVLFRLEAAGAGYAPAQFSALEGRLQERLEQLPGVRSVTYSDIPLISGRRLRRSVKIPDYVAPTGTRPRAFTLTVASNFLSTMELPLLAGRGFTAGDDDGAPNVAVVNRAFAREFFGDGPVVGRRFSWTGSTGPNAEIEIVGVVRDASYTDLRDQPPSTVYTPILQQPPFEGAINFALRVSGVAAAQFSAVRAAVREIDPLLPVRDLRTQDEQLDRLNAQQILFARFAGFFGALALGLACVGLYGLMAYNVQRRTGEIGLRMALGAQPADVWRMILSESLLLVGLGVVVGGGLAVATSRLVAAMLFGLKATDPATYVVVTIILVLIALLAAVIPARRATKVSPMVALRAE